MSSLIANATGTQRQFAQQPQNTYLKQLAGRQAYSAQPFENTDTFRLAKALGALGSYVAAEGQSKEKRDEELQVTAMERIAAGMTDSELKQRNAIDLVASRSQYDLGDNRYGRIAFEKIRGQRFAAEAKAEYELFKSEQPLPKNAQEAVAQFEEFYNNKRGEYASFVENASAFDSGYYDNHIVDKVTLANQYVKEKSTETKTEHVGNLWAGFGKIAYESPGKSKEDIAASWQNLINEGMKLTGMSTAERMKLIESAANQLAMFGADPSQIEALKELTYRVDEAGNDVKIGYDINLNDAIARANMSAQQQNKAKFMSLTEKIAQMTPAEQEEWYTNAELHNLPDYYLMASEKGRLRAFAETRIEKQKKAERKMFLTASLRDAAIQKCMMQLRAYRAGETHDAAGTIVASSMANLPVIEAQDEDGNTVSHKWNKEDLEVILHEELKKIAADPNLTASQKGVAVMETIAFKPFSFYKDIYGIQLKNTFNNLTPDKLTTDVNGNATLPAKAYDAITMYRSNPALFAEVFSDDVTKTVQTYSAMLNTTGDLRQAVSNAADNAQFIRDNPDAANRIRADALSVIKDRTSLKGFINIDGTEAPENISLLDIKGLESAILPRAAAIMQNQPAIKADAALDLAIEEYGKTVFLWDKTIIPRNIFNGIDTSTNWGSYAGKLKDKTYYGQKVLDDFKQQFIVNTGVDASHVSTEWDFTSNVLIIRGGVGKSYKFTINDIIVRAGKYVQEDIKNTQPTLDSAAKTLDNFMMQGLYTSN